MTVPIIAIMNPTIVIYGCALSFLSSVKPPRIGTSTTIANCQLMLRLAIRSADSGLFSLPTLLVVLDFSVLGKGVLIGVGVFFIPFNYNRCDIYHATGQ